MPWFVCGDCGDTIKKPKVAQHTYSCPASVLTCVDCSRDFDSRSVAAHTSCVTEHDKYARGATKPGGHAAGGYYGDEGNGANGGPRGGKAAAAPADGTIAGARHLATRPPWTCSICNVTCTSRDALLGHAAGAKHVRRARAADRAESGKNGSAAASKEGDEAAAASKPDQKAASNEYDKKRASAAAVAPATPPTKKQPRWKKLAVTALKAAPKRKLSEAALVAAVAAAAGVGVTEAEGAASAWLGSSKFKVKKGKVRLVEEK